VLRAVRWLFVLHSRSAFCLLLSDWLCALKFFDYLQRFHGCAARLHVVENASLQKIMAGTIRIKNITLLS